MWGYSLQLAVNYCVHGEEILTKSYDNKMQIKVLETLILLKRMPNDDIFYHAFFKLELF